ncbi:phosphatases II [Pluteus cervinus]|uniref:Phosphatases II n=1 Tax=Pluteus cervinus TaxID=181527 RepID=A0ACD3AZF9_9AGAR|nr:phosphatases II [Pluteus cervinus]
MASQTQIPSWLNDARSPAYMRLVLETLNRREDIRVQARRATRHRDRSDVEFLDSDDEFYIRHGQNSNQEESPRQKALKRFYSVAVGSHPDSDVFNRYAQLEAYDRTRVVAPIPNPPNGGPAGGEGRYLNASWVSERLGQKWWIASQAPLPQSAHAFLSTIFHPIEKWPPYKNAGGEPEPLSSSASTGRPRIRTVVQLTKNIESGRIKAHEYFPNEVGKAIVVHPETSSDSLPQAVGTDSIPSLKVTLLKSQYVEVADCSWMTVSITSLTGNAEPPGEIAVFEHLTYTSWPDHGVPESKEEKQSLLEFLKLVEEVNRKGEALGLTEPRDQPNSLGFGQQASGLEKLKAEPPIIVGCSAGIGRTGTFIALASLFRHLGVLNPATLPTSSGDLEPSPLGPISLQRQDDGANDVGVDDLVLQEVDSLRDQRAGMVERASQVLFIYEMLDRHYSGAR